MTTTIILNGKPILVIVTGTADMIEVRIAA